MKTGELKIQPESISWGARGKQTDTNWIKQLKRQQHVVSQLVRIGMATQELAGEQRSIGII